MASDRTNRYFSTAESAVYYKTHEKQDANAFFSIVTTWYQIQAEAKPMNLETNKKP